MNTKASKNAGLFVLGDMMDEPSAIQRNNAGLIAAGLFLGPIATMLWLGRWKYAVVYFFVILLFETIFFALPVLGVINPIAIYQLSPSDIFALALYPIVIVGLFHAFKLNQQSSPLPWYARWYIALPLPILTSLLIALAVRAFLLQPFNSPSASSEPNLMVGDYFFVSKTAYAHGRGPQAGDIAVFKYPGDTSIDYVKRVVGLPGDKIQMIKGVLNINGTPVKMEEVQLPDYLNGDDAKKKFYRETLPNGRSYVIADLGNTDLDDTDVYVVPAGHYFTLGDNRDNSQDSRFLNKVGYVPAENFVGPVVFKFWNSQGLPLTGRPEEIYPNK